MKKDISITFSVTPQTKSMLDEVCTKHDATKSQVIRAALNAFMCEHNPHSKFMSWMNEETETVLTNPEGY